MTTTGEYELLIRHLRRWLPFAGHRVDEEFLAGLLGARRTHDGLAATHWPRGSARDALKLWCSDSLAPAALDTLTLYWRFLAETGRLTPVCVTPQHLMNEAASQVRHRPPASAGSRAMPH